MVSWNLNTLCFGGVCRPLAHPLTFGEPGFLGEINRYKKRIFFSMVNSEGKKLDEVGRLHFSIIFFTLQGKD